MKFLNFSILLMDGSNKRITTEYKAEDTEIFKEILQKIFQKYNLPLNYDTLLIKDVESANIDPTFWDQKVSEITLIYGILFIIEVYPQVVKQLSEESDEMKEEEEETNEILNKEEFRRTQPLSVPRAKTEAFDDALGALSSRGDALPAPPIAAPPSPLGAAGLSSPKGETPILPSASTSSTQAKYAKKQMDGDIITTKEAKPIIVNETFDKMTQKKKAFEKSDIREEIGKNESAKSGEPQEYDKNIAVEYYDRMNPEQNYILKLNISDLRLADVETRENLLTGERITQKKDKLKILLEDPNVLIRPLFPGCLVTPQEQGTNFDSVEDELSFHITPLVKTEINASIDFISKGKMVYRMPLPAKVDDPRYAKTIVAYGTGISLLPKILPWFGFDVGESLELGDILPFLGTIFGTMALNNFIAILGIILFFIAGIVVFMKKQAKFTKRQVNLADIANYQKTGKREKRV
mgnify:CR=1 FL=1